jgi:predicted dehydrogenase
VAIVGARGIGKHHANWWRLAGVEVAAVAGTSEASLAQTAEGLRALFDFRGRLYTDVGRLLAEERPAFVDVCSPMACHGAPERAPHAAGAHVLCEKPFLYEAGRSTGELLAEADALLAEAARRGLRLALCSQYFVAAETCLRLSAAQPGAGPLTELAGELASPARGRPPDPRATWADLGPHMLAAVQAVVPGEALRAASLRVSSQGDRTVAEFEVERCGAAPLRCRATTYRTEGTANHVRRLTLNGVTFELQGERDASGLYGAKYVFPGGAHTEEDPMRILIRRMAAGEPVLAGAAVRQNLQWLLGVRDRIEGRGPGE